MKTIPDGWREVKRDEITKIGDLYTSEDRLSENIRSWLSPSGIGYRCDKILSKGMVCIRKIEVPRKTINVDGVEIDLNEEQISFLNQEKKMIFKKGDFVTGLANIDHNILVIMPQRKDGRFDDPASTTCQDRPSTPEEIALYRSFIPE